MTAYQYTDSTLISKGKIFKIRRELNTILLFVFAFNAIFLPADTFELKKIALILLLLLNGDCFLRMRDKGERLIFFFGFVVTSVSIFTSFLWTKDLFDNIRVGYVGYILLLYPIIRQYRIDFLKMAWHILTAMAYFIVLMGALDLFGVISMYDNQYLMWIYETDNAFVGKGEHLAIGYVIFMKASPMLFLSLAYCFLRPKELLEPISFQRLKYVNALVIAIALVLTGTRANLLLCAVFAMFCFVYQKRSRLKQMLLLAALALVALYLLSDGRLIQMVWEMFARKAGGDEVRDKTMSSILWVWQDNPKRFLLGSGFSSTFWNTGRGEFVSSVELSYWNLIRQVGIVQFVVMMIGYLYPAMRMLKERRNTLVVLGYFCYLIVAYTNPLLHSSTGMTVLLMMYCLCFCQDGTIDTERQDLLERKDLV